MFLAEGGNSRSKAGAEIRDNAVVEGTWGLALSLPGCSSQISTQGSVRVNSSTVCTIHTQQGLCAPGAWGTGAVMTAMMRGWI